MTVSTTSSRVEYVGNGITTLFPIPFRFLENSHIVVTYVAPDGAQSTWSQGADYVLSGSDDEGGGFLTATSAPPSSSHLIVRRVVPATQETDYISGDPFPAESHERALDKLTMLAQQLDESDQRTLKFPAGDLASQIGELPGAALRANRILTFDSNGRPVTVALSEQSATGLQIALAAANGGSLIGFQQDGVNALVRTMLAKAREIISADDFPTLQEAATVAAGKTLRLTPGKTYTVIDSLAFVFPNTHIEGYGATILYPKPSENFFHCIRATEDGFQARGLRIVMQGTVVRGDSGFGICVFNDTKHIKNTIIQDCHVSGIASAGMWLQDVSEVIVTKNTVKNCLADGIHIADGASQIIVSNNICLDNADDNIALVNDVSGSPYVTGFTITGNYVNCANVAHGGGGIVLIGAVSGVVSGNTMEATYGGGIHMYQWSDNFKTDKVLIIGNKFTNTGRATGSGVNAVGGLGILLQFTAGVHIVGNDFSDIGYNAAAPSNGAVWIADGKNVSITANNFNNIACDAVNALTSGPITGGMILTVNANVFGYVARNAVNLGPVVDLAAATVKDNIFQATAGTHDIYLDKPTATMIVQGNSCKKLVYVNGNSTSLLSRVEVESFTPVIGAAGGAITSSNATMVYQRMGKFVLVSLTVEIVNNGTGAGVITVSLPFPVVSGSLSGRENVVTGVAVMGLMNAGVLQLRRYDNGYPGANGAVLVLSGLLVLP